MFRQFFTPIVVGEARPLAVEEMALCDTALGGKASQLAVSRGVDLEMQTSQRDRRGNHGMVRCSDEDAALPAGNVFLRLRHVPQRRFRIRRGPDAKVAMAYVEKNAEYPALAFILISRPFLAMNYIGPNGRIRFMTIINNIACRQGRKKQNSRRVPAARRPQCALSRPPEGALGLSGRARSHRFSQSTTLVTRGLGERLDAPVDLQFT
ncbi:hypothetical protein EVAR_42856_1 [Eumeta japonica]|uniref:Uncharacterized protein n=1 Tax=Eumeta variegata TaxID=151549 RepID=A0A4C1WJ89_EUMVA|nr:hypothetical protein EVAR_42856_1 [Eumeta japonica]